MNASERLRDWANRIRQVESEGGYAMGDHPYPPLDDIFEVLDENERLRVQKDAAEKQLDRLIDSIWTAE